MVHQLYTFLGNDIAVDPGITFLHAAGETNDKRFVEDIRDPTPAPPRKGRVQEGSGYRRRRIPGPTAISLPKNKGTIYLLTLNYKMRLEMAAFDFYNMEFLSSVIKVSQ